MSLLAAIGQVESGSLAGRALDAAHRAVPPVMGPILDGVGTAAISDTDGGRLDGNPRWDRAVGPMQFIPGTWAGYGVDGDGDGRADPQNVYDSTAAAADYLCSGGRDLAVASSLRSAILAYNHSTTYLATVLAWQQRFSGSSVGTIQAVVGTTQTVIGKNSLPKLPAGASAASGTVHPSPSPSSNLMTPAAANLAFTTSPSPTSAFTTVPSPTSAFTTAPSPTSAFTTAPGPTSATPTSPSPPSPTATSPTATTSSTITAPATLVFATAPSPTALLDTAWDRQPVVIIEDAAGNTVTTDASPVTLTLTTPDGVPLTTPDGATLTCATNPMVAVAGIVRFTGCTIDKAGTYTLIATATTSAGELTSTTRSITITAAPRTKSPSPHPGPR